MGRFGAVWPVGPPAVWRNAALTWLLHHSEASAGGDTPEEFSLRPTTFLTRLVCFHLRSLALNYCILKPF